MKTTSVYDDLFRRKLLLSDPWYRMILKMMEPMKGDLNRKRVLEVGCGLGGFCIRIAKNGGNVIGLDLSLSALKKAKEFAKRYNVQNNIDFVLGDAHFLPFKDDSGDIVVCSETLEHVTNYKKAFSELVRITKKLGYICITIPNMISTLLFENLLLLLLGQPKYAKSFGCLEKEHVFHIFKLKRLLMSEKMKVIEIRSTDFLHLPPRIRKALKMDYYLHALSDQLENYFETHRLVFRLFGANLGVIAQKK